MQYGRFAELYDTLMRDVDYNSWADYVSGFLPGGASILECGCGTGEISLKLASKGYNVTATDISEDMLIIASEKQRRRGLSNASLRFARMDMRSLSHHRKVDGIVSCCDCVNYLASPNEAKQFFAQAYAFLKPGGLLLFDISSMHKLQNVLGNNCFIDNGRDAAYMWQNAYDDHTKLIRMDLSFFKREGELYERFDETHIQRAHSAEELTDWLAELGFTVETYSCFTMDPVSEDDERIQFAARKA